MKRIAVRRGRFSKAWWVTEGETDFGTPFSTWHQAMAHADRLRKRIADTAGDVERVRELGGVS